MNGLRVASKTAIYERASHDVMAQVFATRATIDSLVTPVPTIAAGVALQVVDARLVLSVTSVATAILAIALLMRRREQPLHETRMFDVDIPVASDRLSA